jgi:tetratricopeptide (TPR) repeat protein
MEVLVHFDKQTKPTLRESVAKTMVNKGASLVRLKRYEDAIEVLSEMITHFGDSSEPPIREHLSGAINGMGFVDLLRAKYQWSQANVRTALLAEARSKFEDAIERCPNSPHAFGNLSYAVFLQGHETEAVDPLRQALQLGGEELFNETIKDIETGTVPPDAAFRALLTKIWDEVKRANGSQSPKPL